MTHELNTTTGKDASFNAGLGDESFDQLVGKVLAGAQTLLQENGRRPGEIILNDFLPPNVQADVLLECPQMASHSAALQQAVDEHVKPGMTVRLFGNFKMSKLAGYRPDIYGRDNQPVPGQPLLTRHGAQPCLMLRADNNIYDFSNCVFTVDKLFQDGVHIAGYQGDCRAEHMGHWFTAAILAVDPGKLSASNWKGALGSKGRGNDWLAPIDNNTGFAFKGNTTCGFNTSEYAYDLAPFRNNSLDTSRLSAGGYGRAFPQENGRTAATWGTWRGGWIGNAGSALVIYQLPSVPESARTIAHFTCAGIYGRGFAGAVIEVGLLGKPDSTHLSRWGAGIEPYVPRNIRLHNTLAEDNYTAGIQHNRYIDVWEQGSHIRRSGHPDWSLEHTNPGRPGASSVDPGYGSASGRASPQIRRRISQCTYVDCARKGIDAHHGADTIVEKCYVKAGVWGMQVAFEERQVDLAEASNLGLQLARYIVRDCEFHSSQEALSFHNGAFGWRRNKTGDGRQAWGLRVDVAVENTLLAAPVGWMDNYGRGGFKLNNVTAVFDAPYGVRTDMNTDKYRAFWLGSSNPAERGLPLDYTLNNCRAMNSPVGNYASAMLIEYINVLNMWNFMVDTTPYTTDLAGNGLPAFTAAKLVIRSGRKTHNVHLSPGPLHADISGCYAVSMQTDEVVPFVFPSGNADTEVAIPAEAQAEIVFDFAGATESRIADTRRKVPMQLMKSSQTKVFADTSALIHADERPRNIDGRLFSEGDPAGAYYIVRGVYAEGGTTVVMPVKIGAFGGRQSGWILVAAKPDNSAGSGGLTALSVADDAGRFTLSRSSGVLVNGQPITMETRFKRDEWLIISWTAPLVGRDLALLGRYDGNGVTQGKIGEGLAIYPNRVLDNNALQAKIFELRALYNIQ